MLVLPGMSGLYKRYDVWKKGIHYFQEPPPSHHFTAQNLQVGNQKTTKLNCTLKKDIQITVTHDSIHRLIS